MGMGKERVQHEAGTLLSPHPSFQRAEFGQTHFVKKQKSRGERGFSLGRVLGTVDLWDPRWTPVLGILGKGWPV